MTKNQKIEWALSCVLIILAFVALYESIKHLDIFGTQGPHPVQLISIIALFAAIAAWGVNYIIKVILAYVKKDQSRIVLLSWTLGPVIIAAGTALLVNGAISFNSQFRVFNLLSTVGVILMVLIYNVFFILYFGKGKAYVSLVLYNIVSILLSLKNISFIHNYYLALLIPAIVFGYAELLLTSKKASPEGPA
ncbi:MAG: hypothetical protein IJ757_04650 [Clostridiales bacterium]|nr:hypothetical protein [Clostridiales bacterium]